MKIKKEDSKFFEDTVSDKEDKKLKKFKLDEDRVFKQKKNKRKRGKNKDYELQKTTSRLF